MRKLTQIVLSKVEIKNLKIRLRSDNCCKSDKSKFLYRKRKNNMYLSRENTFKILLYRSIINAIDYYTPSQY